MDSTQLFHKNTSWTLLLLCVLLLFGGCIKEEEAKPAPLIDLIVWKLDQSELNEAGDSLMLTVRAIAGYGISRIYGTETIGTKTSVFTSDSAFLKKPFVNPLPAFNHTFKYGITTNYTTILKFMAEDAKGTIVTATYTINPKLKETPFQSLYPLFNAASGYNFLTQSHVPYDGPYVHIASDTIEPGNAYTGKFVSKNKVKIIPTTISEYNNATVNSLRSIFKAGSDTSTKFTPGVGMAFVAQISENAPEHYITFKITGIIDSMGTENHLLFSVKKE